MKIYFLLLNLLSCLTLYSQDLPLYITEALEKEGVIDRALVEQALQEGVDINARDFLSNTLLIHAIIQRDKNLVDLLLAKGAQVNVFGLFNNTPLIIAAQIGDKDIVESLLAKGAQVNAANIFKTTALSSAVSNNHKAITELLIQHGARLNRKDMFGSTPLSKAAYEKDIALTLAAAGANITELASIEPSFFSEAQDLQALFKAVRQGDTRSVATLLSHLPFPLTFKDKHGNSLLHLAISGYNRAKSKKDIQKQKAYLTTARLLLWHTPKLGLIKNKAGLTPGTLSNQDYTIISLLIDALYGPAKKM
jgi:ankyrin repeat protein